MSMVTASRARAHFQSPDKKYRMEPAELSCDTHHLRGLFRRLCLLFFAGSFPGRSVERLGFHIRAGLAEPVTAKNMLADRTVIFCVQLW